MPFKPKQNTIAGQLLFLIEAIQVKRWTTDGLGRDCSANAFGGGPLPHVPFKGMSFYSVKPTWLDSYHHFYFWFGTFVHLELSPNLELD